MKIQGKFPPYLFSIIYALLSKKATIQSLQSEDKGGVAE